MEKDHIIDGLEVFVKIKMGITLTKDELEIYNNYDADEKAIIFDFINNPSFIDDLNRIIKKILSHTKENNNIRIQKR